ncbi:exopolyphosphatase / guanosine-5'-triphosphate,3'-diphosphate pyrophosphatase [Pseudoxanthobacter soli DSM 19599]|uniref:exopolyphosphatase n=2 Tax=Pseudoxanthobacter TaxID=433838 RepID=A0A1M7ZLB5_9HYPH|nr:exopolyphosphatase / guanosine-5'-triphosphate,3'-diphosphate pyrophosphatase [Pseudoxanthobacter soli DSM 19599]
MELRQMVELAPGRLPGFGPIAVIDIGSNSVRLVIYERLSRSPTVLFNEKVLAGLGRGIAKTGRLQDDAVELALSAVGRFRALCDMMEVRTLDVIATAASRDASNGPEFIAEVERLTGVTVEILSGAEEARRSALGIISGIWKPNGIVGDLGGGSLELVEVRGHEISVGRTFPLGGLRLQEASDGSVRKAEKIASEVLTANEILSKKQGRDFYAVGGTWRSLARLHMFQTGYPLHVMHQYSIPAGEALEFCRAVARGTIETIDSVEVVSRQRRSLLPFGAVVLSQIILAARPKSVIISALGIREGLLYERLDDRERKRDPLLAACEELSLLRSRSPRLATELGEWTGHVFEAMGLAETAEERRLRIAACLLSDIGWRAHPDYRGEQSLALISNASFTGVDHHGRAYLAMAVYFRHFGLVDDALSPRLRELVSTRLKERARCLGAALRLASVLTATAPGVINRIRVDASSERMLLRIPAEFAALDGEIVRKRLDQLARLAGMSSMVVIDP